MLKYLRGNRLFLPPKTEYHATTYEKIHYIKDVWQYFRGGNVATNHAYDGAGYEII